MSRSTKYICRVAVTAALYVILTLLSSLAGISSGVFQLRLSEALCVLPAFTSAAVPGLAIGCFIANLVTGAHILDVVFGSLATLAGACGAFLLRKFKYLVPLPNVLANTLIIPPVLVRVYGAEKGLPYVIATVGVGEILSSYVSGLILMALLSKYAQRIFK